VEERAQLPTGVLLLMVLLAGWFASLPHRFLQLQGGLMRISCCYELMQPHSSLAGPQAPPQLRRQQA
jgi:hypothetical protein